LLALQYRSLEVLDQRIESRDLPLNCFMRDWMAATFFRFSCSDDPISLMFWISLSRD